MQHRIRQRSSTWSFTFDQRSSTWSFTFYFCRFSSRPVVLDSIGLCSADSLPVLNSTSIYTHCPTAFEHPPQDSNRRSDSLYQRASFYMEESASMSHRTLYIDCHPLSGLLGATIPWKLNASNFFSISTTSSSSFWIRLGMLGFYRIQILFPLPCR
jgi:hypothetical protein